MHTLAKGVCRLILWLPAVAWAQSGDVHLDLLAAGGRDQWILDERARISVVDLPEEGRPAGGGDIRSGPVLRLEGAARGFAYTRDGALPPAALAGACCLSFWIRPAEALAEPVDLEVQFLEPDGRSRFWRRVTVADPGWTRVELPLRFFRRAGARIPQWPQVAHLAFFFRAPGAILLDGMSLDEREGFGPRWTHREIRDIAFPSAGPGTVRFLQDAEFVLLSDAEFLDFPVLAHVLSRAAETLRGLFPFFPSPSFPPTLVVFAQEDEYRAFAGRLAAKMGSSAAPTLSGGLTVEGIATSYFDPPQNARRPVFVHEFAHAWIEQAGRLVCDGRWFHEAAATSLQLRFYPQPDFAGLVAAEFRRIRHPGEHLRRITTDERVRETDYWALATFFDMLIATPRYRDALPSLYRAFLQTGSFRLEPILESALGVDFDRLGRDWQSFCAEEYGFEPAPPPEPDRHPPEIRL